MTFPQKQAKFPLVVPLLLAYTLCLLILSPILPLWLDELLNVITSRKPTLAAMLSYVSHNSAAVPMGYLAQRLSFSLFGFSEFSARLPSVLSSVAAAIGVYVLARQLKSQWPTVVVILFCLLPLQWRYALEGRSYALALAFSVWSTVAFLALVENPRALRAFSYLLLLTLGLYTNPYSVFVAVAHLVWLFVQLRKREASRSAFAYTLAAIAFAGLLFLPWYFHARSDWVASIPQTGHTAPLGVLKLLTKELTGAGYLGTLLVASLIVAGCSKLIREGRQSTVYLLSLCVAAPIVLALAGNGFFHYFLAIRQMIFILPALCLLVGFGLELSNRSKLRWTACLFAGLLATSIFEDINLFLKPHEDWRAAVSTIKSLSNPGSCFLFAPADSVDLYSVFDANLAAASCNPSGHYSRIILATSPYAYLDTSHLNSVQVPSSFQKQSERTVGKTTITVFEPN